jgi:hypothetical protein
VSFASLISANGIRWPGGLVAGVASRRADRSQRTVPASPAEVFLIVTDPAMQVEIDGSGT